MAASKRHVDQMMGLLHEFFENGVNGLSTYRRNYIPGSERKVEWQFGRHTYCWMETPVRRDNRLATGRWVSA
jgi:hypothetical protein